MSDKCRAEMNGIAEVWPESINLLCHFHVLQYVYKWLKENISDETDRRNFITNFQMILYSMSETDAEDAYESALELGKIYPEWVEYLGDQWLIKEQWCMAYRHRLTNGNHTNNYAEVMIRLFKDLVLERFQSYNLVTLVNSIITTMEEV